MIDTILIIVALVFFALAAFRINGPVEWGWAGLFCWALTLLI